MCPYYHSETEDTSYCNRIHFKTADCRLKTAIAGVCPEMEIFTMNDENFSSTKAIDDES